MTAINLLHRTAWQCIGFKQPAANGDEFNGASWAVSAVLDDRLFFDDIRHSVYGNRQCFTCICQQLPS